ncbi:hypothetical protein OH77DRAFT_1428211 [Trametes cingulata]|nr:hypothetical protein OH77DRAFT_1428211 [Trametes cingulata]
MIFTTVLVTCLFALLGVFQQVSVDTILSTLSPTLSSAIACMHVVGSAKRLVLDASPFGGDLFFGPPNGARATSLAPLNLDIPVLPNNISTWATATSSFSTLPERLVQPRDHFRHRLYIDALIIVVITLVCAIGRTVLDITAAPSAREPSVHANNTSRPQSIIAQVEWDAALANHAEDEDDDATRTGEVPYEPLSFTRSPTSTTRVKLLCAPVPAYIPPSLSASSYAEDPDADCTRVFGVPLWERAAFAHTNDVDDDGHDYDDYLRQSLNIPLDGAPPVAGWSQSEQPGALGPSRYELRSWCFPDAHADVSYPGMQDGAPLPTWYLEGAFPGLLTEEPWSDEDLSDGFVLDDPFLDEPLVAVPSLDDSLLDAPILDAPILDAPILDTPTLDEPLPEDLAQDEEPLNGPLLIREYFWHDPFLDECFAASESVLDGLRTLRAHPSFYDEAVQVIPNLLHLFTFLDEDPPPEGDLDDPFWDVYPIGEG